MTARLPIVDGDVGNWGVILNDFLEVSHNGDGTLLPAALTQAGGVTSVNTVVPDSSGNVTLTAANVGAGTYSKPAGGSPAADLDFSAQTDLTLGSIAYQKPGSGIPASDLSTSVQTGLTSASTAIQSVNGKTGTS